MAAANLSAGGTAANKPRRTSVAPNGGKEGAIDSNGKVVGRIGVSPQVGSAANYARQKVAFNDYAALAKSNIERKKPKGSTLRRGSVKTRRRSTTAGLKRGQSQRSAVSPNHALP